MNSVIEIETNDTCFELSINNLPKNNFWCICSIILAIILLAECMYLLFI